LAALVIRTVRLPRWAVALAWAIGKMVFTLHIARYPAMVP